MIAHAACGIHAPRHTASVSAAGVVKENVRRQNLFPRRHIRRAFAAFFVEWPRGLNERVVFALEFLRRSHRRERRHTENPAQEVEDHLSFKVRVMPARSSIASVGVNSNVTLPCLPGYVTEHPVKSNSTENAEAASMAAMSER